MKLTPAFDVVSFNCAAKWTPDCSGKQDYDGPLISVSTRYWPQGGGYMVTQGGVIEENDARPHIKPSAHSSILLNVKGDGITIFEEDFEGETEADVKAKVEAWVHMQCRRIIYLIVHSYPIAVEARSP